MCLSQSHPGTLSVTVAPRPLQKLGHSVSWLRHRTGVILTTVAGEGKIENLQHTSDGRYIVLTGPTPSVIGIHVGALVGVPAAQAP